ncbi:MAG: hypothetical protein QOJ29_1786 [Thermoleophilaceae bacterium]|jgi:radical SAM protein with 4Fe4S-binding SPASM domain|nr:hypothetical protein [Thermoleophilaceae bacterium]
MPTPTNNGRRIAGPDQASSCYFRTTTNGADRKALLQITERCNLHCAHCFVSAVKDGLDLSLSQIEQQILPQLAAARVTRLTLTGGEPFAHPDLLAITSAARRLQMTVTICTNGTFDDEAVLDALQALGGVAVNVSLDGFSAQSHGKFRGDPASFETTKATVAALGRRGLLKGILSTPNSLAQAVEYDALCRHARDCGAEYVLMNPLAPLGRGVKGQRRLAAETRQMNAVRRLTAAHASDELDIVHIRFPNDHAPLSGCEAGTIIYVFANGDVTVCPYLVFAARTPDSRYPAGDFIVGNALDNDDIPARLDRYRLHDRTTRPDPVCDTCALAAGCGRGCPAAVIGAGGTLGDRDPHQCPIEAADQAA